MQLELIDSRAPEVEKIWRELDEPSRSFFTSWAWMENWLACVPRDHAPELVVIRDGTKPVAAFFLRRAPLVRLRVVRSRAMYFNITGNDRLDELLIEYNGLVGREISISALREWMAEIGQRARVGVATLGKIKTIVQMIALVVLLHLHDFPELRLYRIGEYLLVAAATLTIWSALVYVRAAWPVLRDRDG